MPKSNDADAHRLPDGAAERVLARAAELDAASTSGLSVAQLRSVALEAGIGPEAFEAALNAVRGELGSVNSAVSLPTAVGGRVPTWVQLCLFGVPDRRSAMTFYWIFAGGLCAMPVLAISGAQEASTTIAGALFLMFAAWSTSRAVRWVDEHGWNLMQ